jgi:TrfA protein
MSENDVKEPPAPESLRAALAAVRESETVPPPAPSLAEKHADLLEGLAPELRSALTKLGEVTEERAAAKGVAQPEAVAQGRQAVQMMLPLFEAAYALPNAFLRSALFPALDTKATRRFLKGEKLYAVGEWWVKFTGEQFDQSDLDVLAGILEIGSTTSIGCEFTFSSYSLLKRLGRSTGGDQYAALHQAIIRLKGGVVEIGRGKRGRIFAGNFLDGNIDASEAKPSGERTYKVNLNPKLGVLFGFDMWSQVHRQQRLALGKNQTAKGLMGYYASHANPGAHRYETLADLVGMKNKQRSDVKRKIIKAHDALAAPEVGFLKGYEAGPETIAVEKNHTPSQLRHIDAKAPRKRGRPAKNPP